MSEADARSVVLFSALLPSSDKFVIVTGDPDVGRRLFFESSGCSSCHMFGGRGDILAPDLTQIRTRYAPDQLLAGCPSLGL